MKKMLSVLPCRIVLKVNGCGSNTLQPNSVLEIVNLCSNRRHDGNLNDSQHYFLAFYTNFLSRRLC
jgi:hypothetical protein